MIFACSICSYTTDKKCNLETHKNRKRPCKKKTNEFRENTLINQILFECNACKRTFSGARYLTQHSNVCLAARQVHVLQERIQELEEVKNTSSTLQNIIDNTPERHQHSSSTTLQNPKSTAAEELLTADEPSEGDKDATIAELSTTIAKLLVSNAKTLVSNAKPRRRKNPLSAAVRMALWNQWCGEKSGIGQCFCCNQEVTQQAFEAGHVISTADGGSDHIDNLRVVCKMCNLSMGAKNMLEFRMKYFFR